MENTHITQQHISQNAPQSSFGSRRTLLKRRSRNLSTPCKKTGQSLSPRNVPPPPRRVHTVPPPAPPRIRIEQILNENSRFQMRQKSKSTSSISINQSTTDIAALSPNGINISPCPITLKSTKSENTFTFPKNKKKMKRSNSTKAPKSKKMKKRTKIGRNHSASEPPLNDQIFVKMNKIKTYSVTYRGSNCGLELYPFDVGNQTGAVVLKCHNVYSSKKVIVNSLLVGINDEIVVKKDYSMILKMITSLPRPICLTFYSPMNSNGKCDGTDDLKFWLSTDDSMRFESMNLRKMK